MKLTWKIGAICTALGFASGSVFSDVAYPPLQIILSSSETVLRQKIVYPDGTARITAAVVTMPPGDSTGWHKHNAPMFAWVLEGELTVDYGVEGQRTYKAGDGLLEAFGSFHNGTNTGSTEARIMAVFSGAEGTQNTEMAP